MKATLYKAPHVRNATTSHANGRCDGIRTYSQIPFHLRKDVPIQTQQKKRIGNHNESNTDHSRRVTINPPPIQTRVERQIHTPARFVQLVHVVIAPNEIYCGPTYNSVTHIQPRGWIVAPCHTGLSSTHISDNVCTNMD